MDTNILTDDEEQKPNIRAGLYCRVSTKGQKKRGLSLPDQQNALTKRARENNHEVLPDRIWIEQKSGSTFDRPKWRECEQAMAAGKFDILYVEDISRIGRNRDEVLAVGKKITENYRIRVISLYEGELNLTTTDGELMFGLKTCINDANRKRTIEKSRSRLLAKLEVEGQRNIGRLLYGLRWAQDRKSAEWHPEEYPKVRLVIELRLELKWSYVRIADFLNGKICDRHGQQIAVRNNVRIPTTYRAEKPWDRNKVGYIFSNPRYYLGEGCVNYRRTDQNETPTEYTYSFPRLMKKAEYNQLQKVLPDYITTKSRQFYLLSGKCVCGLCGGTLHHNVIQNKYKGKVMRYEYYTCRNKLEKPPNKERCCLRSAPREWLEKRVWNQIQRLFGDKQHFEEVIFRADNRIQADDQRLDAIADRLIEIEKAIEEVDKQIKNVVDFIANAAIIHDEATKKIAELKESKQRLEEERQKLEFAESAITRQGLTIERVEQSRLWWQAYGLKLPDEQKRQLLDAVVERIEVSPIEPEPDEDYRTLSVDIIGKIPMVPLSIADYYRSGKESECFSAGE